MLELTEINIRYFNKLEMFDKKVIDRNKRFLVCLDFLVYLGYKDDIKLKCPNKNDC